MDKRCKQVYEELDGVQAVQVRAHALAVQFFCVVIFTLRGRIQDDPVERVQQLRLVAGEFSIRVIDFLVLWVNENHAMRR